MCRKQYSEVREQIEDELVLPKIVVREDDEYTYMRANSITKVRMDEIVEELREKDDVR